MSAPEGLVEVRPFPFQAARRSFTGPTLEAERISVRYLRRGADGPLLAQVRFGPDSEGAPGRAHGGAVLTVLDEAMGAACWVRGLQVLTGRLSAAFRLGVPLETPLVVETALIKAGSRLIVVRGRLVDEAGVLYAEGEGSFVRLRPEQARAAFGGVSGVSVVE